MINFAHRGASQYAPENTMAAFNLGVKMGADGIETDVQETSDGKLVLFHDSSLKRTLSIDGSIRDYTWRELSKFDAGIYKGEEYRRILFEPVSQEGKERKISSNESLTKRHGKANLGMQGFERNLQMEALLFYCGR